MHNLVLIHAAKLRRPALRTLQNVILKKVSVPKERMVFSSKIDIQEGRPQQSFVCMKCRRCTVCQSGPTMAILEKHELDSGEKQN